MNSPKFAVYTLLIILCIFIASSAQVFFPPIRGWNWIIVLLLMIAFVILLGKEINGRYGGIFINERFRMSLSRFQLVIWTLIVLSAFITIALERVVAGVADPLAIALPTQLWALLGISTASLVGSPLILSTKKTKKPNPEAIDKIAQSAADADPAISLSAIEEATEKIEEAKLIYTLGSKELKDAEASLNKIKTKRQETIDEAKLNIQKNSRAFGILASESDVNKAELSNLFTGDEIQNSKVIDMAKVQQFFFTIIIAFTYAFLLATMIWTTDPIELTSFPELSDGLVALLGISSGGYITSKAIVHTKT